MAPESCTKTPDFVIMNTLFIIALLRVGLNLLSLIYWPYKVFSSRKNTSCMFSPAYFKVFHCLWGVDSGMLVNCCCRPFGVWVDQDMPIPLLHENGHRELNCSAMEMGQMGAGEEPELHIICSSAFSLTSSDCYSESLWQALQLLRYKF